MIEKPKRPKKLNNQDRKIPINIQELINRYDLENKDIYTFLDYLVDSINDLPTSPEIIDNLTSTSATNPLSARQGNILKQLQDDIEKKLNYSTTEQVIGKWMNKPLYRKTFVYTLPSNVSTGIINIPHGITNLKMVTDVKLTVPTGTSSGYIIPFTNKNGSANSITSYNNQYLFFEIYNDTWGQGREFHITVEYTKTTD